MEKLVHCNDNGGSGTSLLKMFTAPPSLQAALASCGCGLGNGGSGTILLKMITGHVTAKQQVNHESTMSP